MNKLFNPSFKTKKKEIRKMIQYELTERDLKGDFRPNVMLSQRIEDKFFDAIPTNV